MSGVYVNYVCRVYKRKERERETDRQTDRERWREGTRHETLEGEADLRYAVGDVPNGARFKRIMKRCRVCPFTEKEQRTSSDGGLNTITLPPPLRKAASAFSEKKERAYRRWRGVGIQTER